MDNGWVENELKTVNLEDKRLNDRFAEILKALGEHPNLSIPAACGGHSETVAAYRFFDNKKTNFEKILAPHHKATEERVAAQAVVLCVQDTTELDLTRPDQQIRGAGVIDGSDTRRGAYLHLLEAFTPDGTALGAVWAKTLIRAEKEERTKEEIKKRQLRLRSIPLEEKESYRWLEGYIETINMAKRNPGTTCICVCDSEADMFEIFSEPRVENSHLLIRACQDRTVEATEPYVHIRDVVYSKKTIATKKMVIRERIPAIAGTSNPRQGIRNNRDAVMEIRKATVTIRPPLYRQSRYDNVTMNIVVVSEKSPPRGERAIEWMLLTTLPVSTLEEVLTVIEYYETRWMIEIFFKTLKSGCKIESLQFEEMDRLLPCLAVYLIASWRVLMICRLGRSHPDWNCEIVFTPAEWKSTYRIMHPKKKLPKRPPTMDFMIRLVGKLGGWTSTSGQKEMPGPQTTWIGLQRVSDFATAWKTFGPDVQNE